MIRRGVFLCWPVPNLSEVFWNSPVFCPGDPGIQIIPLKLAKRKLLCISVFQIKIKEFNAIMFIRGGECDVDLCKSRSRQLGELSEPTDQITEV